MNRRHFLSAGALALLPTSRLAAASVDEAAIDRFCEVVRKVEAEWYPASGSARSLALRAISKQAATGYDTSTAALRGSIRFEADMQRRPAYNVAQDALHRYVQSLDPWSEYLDPLTLKQFQASQNSSYCGVGMDLEKEQNGTYTCWPYPRSVAEYEGIKPGAKLTAVNGIPVSTLTLYGIGARVRGPEGSRVALTVSGGFPGTGRELWLIRRRAHSETVFPYSGRHGPGVRIARFSKETPGQLLRAIGSDGYGPVEIDLRDCRGGDLDAAVDCASLFLPTSTRIATIQRRRGGESLRAGGGAKLERQIVLLQNGNTASSAELFIRALTARGAAISSGPRTKGKGTTQTVIPMASGGALVLTTGLLLDPVNKSWHNSGLSAVS